MLIVEGICVSRAKLNSLDWLSGILLCNMLKQVLVLCQRLSEIKLINIF
jgi:hypothetical protein